MCPVADPDLEIRWGGGGGGHPDPEMGGGAVLKFFSVPSGPQWSIKKEGPGIRHWCHFSFELQNSRVFKNRNKSQLYRQNPAYFPGIYLRILYKYSSTSLKQRLSAEFHGKDVKDNN